MGDSYLIFFPADRFHVPTAEQIARTAALFNLLGGHQGISFDAHERPVLIHPQENFDGVHCPACDPDDADDWDAEDDEEWWWEAIDRFGDDGTFTVTVPCCGRTFGLDELDYGYAPGFARFSIEVLNPEWDCLFDGGPDGLPEVGAKALLTIMTTLGCPVRYLWQHI